MALTVKEKKPQITDIPQGKYLAICVGIFDLGTIENRTFNKKEEKVLFLFELPGVVNNEGWPRTVNQRFTASLHEKSGLRPFLIDWRERNFTKAELENFDIKEFLGKPARLLIVHNEGKGAKAGNIYANIQSISAVPESEEVPRPYHPLVSFDFGDGVAAIPEGTPEFIEKIIVDSPDWRQLKAGGKPAPKEQAMASGRKDSAAPKEVLPLINALKLDWPYDQSELDAKFDPEAMGDEEYETLSRYASPF